MWSAAARCRSFCRKLASGYVAASKLAKSKAVASYRTPKGRLRYWSERFDGEQYGRFDY
jgi:hypothetical protein